MYQRARLTVHLGLAEPFGLVALESMAAGTPVLAHRAGGIAEIVIEGESGWCRPNLRGEDLVSLLAVIPERSAELEAMGHAARALVESRFRFDQTARSLLGGFDRVASGFAAEISRSTLRVV
jgi:glycosyltransferase involved in cell wall biosynthesis